MALGLMGKASGDDNATFLFLCHIIFGFLCRKLQSSRHSLSPSPTRSRRYVSIFPLFSCEVLLSVSFCSTIMLIVSYQQALLEFMFDLLYFCYYSPVSEFVSILPKHGNGLPGDNYNPKKFSQLKK